MAWPKIIEINGIKIEVDSWHEIQEAMEVFGTAAFSEDVKSRENGATPKPPQQSGPLLQSSDRILLQRFIEAGKRGLLVSQVGEVLGRQRKAVQPELAQWSMRIGLTQNVDALAFEPFRRSDGFALRMKDHYLLVGRQLIGI